MLSTTLIMVVLGGGYSLSAHSLGNALRASQRSHALALAQSQVEFIKAAAIADPLRVNFANTYQTATTYCIDPNGQRVDADQSSGLCNPYDDPGGDNFYKIGVKYDGVPGGSGAFTITAQWQNGSEAGIINSLQLNYRLPS